MYLVLKGNHMNLVIGSSKVFFKATSIYLLVAGFNYVKVHGF